MLYGQEKLRQIGQSVGFWCGKGLETAARSQTSERNPISTSSLLPRHMQVQRNQTTKGFSIFIFIIMWALTIFCVVHAVWVMAFRPDPAVPYDVPAYSGEGRGAGRSLAGGRG